MTRYLLGDVSEKEQLQLEEEFLASDEAFDELLIQEEELIDAYAGGELSAADRARFEKHFLARPQSHQRVGFASALKTLATQAPIAATERRTIPEPLAWWRSLLVSRSAQPSGVRWLAAAAAIALFLGGTWLTVEALRLRGEIERLQVHRGTLERLNDDLQQQVAAQRAGGGQPAAELQREPTAPASPTRDSAAVPQQQPLVVSFILLPGLVRDMTSARQLSIPLRAETVQLQLDLIDLDVEDYPRYRATLRNADGVEIWNQDVSPLRRAAGQAVLLRVPAGVLASGDHIVLLSGATKGGQFEEIGAYHFRAIKR